MRNTQCTLPTKSPVWCARAHAWFDNLQNTPCHHLEQQALHTLDTMHPSLWRHNAHGWPVKYTKHTISTKHTGPTSPGRHMVGHTRLPIQPLWNLSCSVPPTPISPWRYKYKYKHTHEIREVKSQKKSSPCSMLLVIPLIFFSNQIDLDNPRWNSSRYSKMSFLVVLDQRILWRNQESCWTSSLVLFRSGWVALSALWSKLDLIQKCISRNFPPGLSKLGKRKYFWFLCWLIN